MCRCRCLKSREPEDGEKADPDRKGPGTRPSPRLPPRYPGLFGRGAGRHRSGAGSPRPPGTLAPRGRPGPDSHRPLRASLSLNQRAPRLPLENDNKSFEDGLEPTFRGLLRKPLLPPRRWRGGNGPCVRRRSIAKITGLAVRPKDWRNGSSHYRDANPKCGRKKGRGYARK